MSFYRTCPDCGANLDPGEGCDCKQGEKENGLPDSTHNSPRKDGKSLSSNRISQKNTFVKGNLLRELRVERNIPSQDLIRIVHELYPKYDKTLQSKCEHGEDYGIELRRDALDALIKTYAPELMEREKRRRDGGHKLTKRISFRLQDDDYDRLVRYTREDGFEQMQAWLTFVVIRYLTGKEKRNVRQEKSVGSAEKLL